MTDKRKAIARSKVYKIQLNAIRLKLWDLDETSSKNGELTRRENEEYHALEIAEKHILKAWRKYRATNGLSNEAVD